MNARVGYDVVNLLCRREGDRRAKKSDLVVPTGDIARDERDTSPGVVISGIAYAIGARELILPVKLCFQLVSLFRVRVADTDVGSGSSVSSQSTAS